MLTNSPDRYGTVARALHWTIALLILALIPLGWYISGLDYYDPAYRWAPSLHRSTGLLVLVLALVRIAWALLDRAPPLAASLKPWERLGAKFGHRVLYLMTVLIPVSGYLVSTADGHPVQVFGLFELPALLAVDEAVAEVFDSAHVLFAWGTLAVVVVHAAAALKHQLIDRDGTLSRMAGRAPRR